MVLRFLFSCCSFCLCAVAAAAAGISYHVFYECKWILFRAGIIRRMYYLPPTSELQSKCFTSKFLVYYGNAVHFADGCQQLFILILCYFRM